MKKYLLTFVLLFVFSAYPYGWPKTDGELMKENEKHLPAQFLEYEQYFPKSGLPIWLQQRCAYVTHRVYLSKWCNAYQMTHDKIEKYGFSNACVNRNNIHFNAEYHAEISFELSMAQIGHEIGHIQDGLGRLIIIPVFIGLYTATVVSKKYPKINNAFFKTIHIVNGLNLFYTFQSQHLQEKYADLKGIDSTEGICDSKAACIENMLYHNHPGSDSHPPDKERVRCLIAYDAWKKRVFIHSPGLFLLHDKLTMFKPRIDARCIGVMK